MKNDIKTYVSNCKTSFVSNPSKSEAKHSGLSNEHTNEGPVPNGLDLHRPNGD